MTKLVLELSFAPSTMSYRVGYGHVAVAIQRVGPHEPTRVQVSEPRSSANSWRCCRDRERVAAVVVIGWVLCCVSARRLAVGRVG
jgi:hypothetical protein